MKEKIFPYKIKNHSILLQIILALIFIPLQHYSCYLITSVWKLPLFMDMIFLYTASFFGPVCGILFSFGIETFTCLIIQNDWSNYFFVICYLTGFLIVRVLVRKNEKITLMSLIFISLLSALLISIEGGIIFTIFYPVLRNDEVDALKYITYSFAVQKIPVYISAILSRLAVNLLDKFIAVMTGFAVFAFIQALDIMFDNS